MWTVIISLFTTVLLAADGNDEEKSNTFSDILPSTSPARGPSDTRPSSVTMVVVPSILLVVLILCGAVFVYKRRHVNTDGMLLQQSYVLAHTWDEGPESELKIVIMQAVSVVRL